MIDLKERSIKIREETNVKLDKLIVLKEKDINLKQMEFQALQQKLII